MNEHLFHFKSNTNVLVLTAVQKLGWFASSLWTLTVVCKHNDLLNHNLEVLIILYNI